MKRAVFLATVALLAMLILAPMAWAQGGTTKATNNKHLNPCERIAKVVRLESRPLTREEIRIRNSGVCNQGHDVFTTSPGSATSSASASPVSVPPSGGPALLLPAAALLLGSGILTYAFLRRR
jgi:hypothetical protein